MPDLDLAARLAAIRGRHAIWPAMPDVREEAPNDLEWALTEIERLRTVLTDATKAADGIYEDCRDVNCFVGAAGAAALRQSLLAALKEAPKP